MATDFDCFTRRLPKDPDLMRATEALLAAAVAAQIRSPASVRHAAKALYEATGAAPRDSAAMLDLLERPCGQWLPRAGELGDAGEGSRPSRGRDRGLDRRSAALQLNPTARA